MTVSLYEPVLTYETSFDRKEGDKQKTYVKERDEDSDPTGVSVSRYIRIFDGDTIEELLFSILNFESKAKDMDMMDTDRVKEFQMTLGTAPHVVWNQLLKKTDSMAPLGRMNEMKQRKCSSRSIQTTQMQETRYWR